MTVVEGSVESIGMSPLSGLLTARVARFRPSGGVLFAPESVPYPIVAGQVSADLAPGPAQLTVQVGSHARERFDVVIPDEGPVSLAALVEEAFPWEPEQVAEFVRLRDEAVAAADRAEQAAEDVDSAIAGAADQVVAAVEADRVAAEQAASDAAGSASSAAGSASDAATSAATAGDQATLAGERADDAGVARDATSASAAAAAGSASDAASSATDAAGAATAAAGSASSAAGSASDAAGSATDAETARAGAEDARDAADGHADRAELAANSFDLTATATTGAPGTDATVTVSGDGPAYSLSFTVPRGAKGDKGDKGDRGDDGEVSQAMLDAAVASLVDGAPEALDTLQELADALGNDPNFATTVSTEIGKRALIDGAPEAYNTLGKLVTALQNHELGGSTDASLLTGALTDQVDASAAMVTLIHPLTLAPIPGAMNGILANALAVVGQAIDPMLDAKSDVGHTHTADEVGLGNVDNTSDAAKPVSTATQAALTPLQNRVGAAPATWRWDGTTLPTSASQVHAQARVGDFIVAPNLDTDPGWHQITGV